MKRYKKNCNGDFFVEEDQCILCTLPESEAPNLMESDENSCYFVRQPKTDDEIQQAIDAIAVSCCSAVKYGGKDKKIIEKILSEPYADPNSIIYLGLMNILQNKLNIIRNNVAKKT